MLNEADLLSAKLSGYRYRNLRPTACTAVAGDSLGALFTGFLVLV